MALSLLLVGMRVAAQGDEWRLPGDTVASWIFSPGEAWEAAPPGPLAPSIRVALGAGLIRDDDARLTAKILAGVAAVGEHPHRLVVRRFRARPVDVQGGMNITDLEAVLEVRTSRTHLPLVSTLESLLIPAAGVGVVQREIELPARGQEERRGVELVRDDLPGWARVSWISEPGVFTVAVGEGALGRWLSWRDGAADETPAGVLALREQPGVPMRRGAEGVGGVEGVGGRRTLEAWANLNAIRHGFPLAFDSSRLERVLIAIGVINARELALVAHEGEKRGGISLTWAVDSRADPPGRWQRFELTSDRAGRPMRDSSYSLGFEFDLLGLERFGLRVYQAALKPRSLVGFGIQRRRWLSNHGAALRRLDRALGERALLADAPPAPLRFPGIATLVVPLSADADAESARRDLSSLLDGLASELQMDRRTGIWSIGLVPPDADPAGLLRIGAIGIAGDPPALIVSWSPSALEEAARAWSRGDGEP